MTLALLDTRRNGAGAQLSLRDDGSLEIVVTVRHGSILLAHGDLVTAAQTRELWHQLGAALLHPDLGHWRPCPSWNDGCHCAPLFACQRGDVAHVHAETSADASACNTPGEAWENPFAPDPAGVTL